MSIEPMRGEARQSSMTRISRLARRAAFPLVLAPMVMTGCTAYELNPPAPAMIRADAGEVVNTREIVALVPDATAAATLRRGDRQQGLGFGRDFFQSQLFRQFQNWRCGHVQKLIDKVGFVAVGHLKRVF